MAARPSNARTVRQQGDREQGEGDAHLEPATLTTALTTRLLGHAFLIAQLGQSRAEAGKQLQEAAEQQRASLERRCERMEPDGSSSSSISSGGGSTVVRVDHLQLACRLLVKHAGAPAAGVAETLRWVVGCAQHAQLPTRLPVLSLQRAQPLELTASHPALQSLLIAQAIGHGTLVSHLPELLNGRVAPPWQWGPQWAGTLLLGTTLGRPFSENLLRLGQVGVLMVPPVRSCMQVLTTAPPPLPTGGGRSAPTLLHASAHHGALSSPHRWRQVRSQPACSAIGVRSSCPRATGQQPSKRSQGC